MIIQSLGCLAAREVLFHLRIFYLLKQIAELELQLSLKPMQCRIRHSGLQSAGLLHTPGKYTLKRILSISSGTGIVLHYLLFPFDNVDRRPTCQKNISKLVEQMIRRVCLGFRMRIV